MSERKVVWYPDRFKNNLKEALTEAWPYIKDIVKILFWIGISWVLLVLVLGGFGQ